MPKPLTTNATYYLMWLRMRLTAYRQHRHLAAQARGLGDFHAWSRHMHHAKFYKGCLRQAATALAKELGVEAPK